MAGFKKRAFSLVELMVSLALLSILMLCLSRFVLFMQRTVHGELKDASRVVAVASALDLLRRDLSATSTRPDDWHPEECVFRKYFRTPTNTISSICIAWQVRGGRLMRIEGDYHFTAKQWTHSTSNLVLQGVEGCRMGLKKTTSRVRGVSFVANLAEGERRELFVSFANHEGGA